MVAHGQWTACNSVLGPYPHVVRGAPNWQSMADSSSKAPSSNGPSQNRLHGGDTSWTPSLPIMMLTPWVHVQGFGRRSLAVPRRDAHASERAPSREFHASARTPQTEPPQSP